MPNHVTTELILADEQSARIFKDVATVTDEKGDVAAYSLALAMPAFLNPCFTSATWYEHNTFYYGTKWDLYNTNAQEFQGDRIVFNTAWSYPNLRVWAALGIRADGVTLDEGMNFGGTLVLDEYGANYSEAESLSEVYETLYGVPYETEDDENDPSETS